MVHYITSVDAGNGGVNAYLQKGSVKPKRVYFPSVRAAATGDTLGLGADLELQYDYVDWNGHRYVVGDDVLRVNRRHLERHMGQYRYGDEFHQFLVAVAIGQLGVKTGEIDLNLFAPPGMYLGAKTAMQERFMEHDGVVQIRFKNDKKTRQWQYTNVTVYPEGIGAAACFIIDKKGNVVNSDALNGEVVVLDCGAHTLDALQLVDGNFNPETLEHATWDNGGLHTHLREPVLRIIKKKSDDFANVTVDDIDAVIRQGSNTGDYTLRVAGYELDLKPLIDKYRERYAGWIANNICDGVFNSFNGIRAVILVGGGTSLIEDFMQELVRRQDTGPQEVR